MSAIPPKPDIDRLAMSAKAQERTLEWLTVADAKRRSRRQGGGFRAPGLSLRPLVTVPIIAAE